MHLLICTNFAKPFHTGGAERVVQQIAESFANDFNIECTVLTQHGSHKIKHNNVTVIPCGNLPEHAFIKLLLQLKPSCILIYSDWFFRLPTILQYLSDISCKIILVPVGFNRLRSTNAVHAQVKQSFIKHINKFDIVVHSDGYEDAKFCKENNLRYSIIPNAIDISEFAQTSNFRAKYQITSSKLLLCVSNFFPGKGQEFLLPIVEQLSTVRNDFTLVFISTTVSFAYANKRRADIRLQAESKKLPVLFLQDIERQDTLDALNSADVFLFPSQQEVSPLVLLETMAAGKPWISLDVGNATDLQGGFCIPAPVINSMRQFDSNISNIFLNRLQQLLDNPDVCNRMGELGKKQIIEQYDWKMIKHLYKDIFDACIIRSNDRI